MIANRTFMTRMARQGDVSRRHLVAGLSGVTALAAGIATGPAQAVALRPGTRAQQMMAVSDTTRHLREMSQASTPDASPVAQPDMHGAVYPFQVGDFACHAVSDGASMSPDGAVLYFAKTPPERLEEVLDETGLDPTTMIGHHTSIVIDTGTEMVLVDTGFGPDFSPHDGLLLGNLEVAGIAPEDIDVVVITHGHPDHIGGNLDADGNPVFSNARYVMPQEDWDFWIDRPLVEETMSYAPEFAQLMLDYVERQLLPLDGAIDLIGFDEEIVPGITSLDARGHTPGHMALKVESGDERFWILGDVAFGALQLAYPDLLGAPDIDPEQTIETRLRLFDELAQDGGLVTFYHADPFPSMGRIVPDGDVWGWEAVEAEDATPGA